LIEESELESTDYPDAIGLKKPEVINKLNELGLIEIIKNIKSEIELENANQLIRHLQN